MNLVDFFSTQLTSQKTLIIGHRGCPSLTIENTIDSIRLASQLNLDVIEIDIQFTKDGIPVLFHDETMKRLAGLTTRIQECTFLDLKQLDLRQKFNGKHKMAKICSLEECLEAVQQKTFLNIEIKNFQKVSEFNLNHLDSIISKFDIHQNITISCFDIELLKSIKKLNKKLNVSLLHQSSWNMQDLTQYVDLLKPISIHTNQQNLNHIQINNSHIPIFVYTVNDKKTLQNVIENGASGIFTDFPQIFIAD